MTSNLYESCQELFRSYPMAVRSVDRADSIRSMIVMIPDGANAGFFAIADQSSCSRHGFGIWSWPAGDVSYLTSGKSVVVPEELVDAVTRGTPIPTDGSLFGWLSAGSIIALVVIYAQYTKQTPYPGWSVMPMVGTPADQWPAFTGRDLLGNWSWDYLKEHRLVSLDSLVAQNPDTVFWTTLASIPGQAYCVVAQDVVSAEGYRLSKGRYAYYRNLEAAEPVPSVEALLAEESKIDLAPRFQRPTRSAA